jgi:hypothetical protein
VLLKSNSHEVFFGKKNFISHLRVFCCDAFVHVPKEYGNKMDNKEIKCIFIEYKYGKKGYKLWDPVLIKIVYSQDVASR